MKTIIYEKSFIEHQPEMLSLQNLVYQLFNSELKSWQLAKEKYAELEKSVSKSLDFGDFSVDVVCNPARLRSTMAEVKQRAEQMRTTKTNIAAQPPNTEDKCFLCANVRPKEQKSIEVNDFQILINPYPIFPKHFTIAHKKHTPQFIMPYFADFLLFAKKLPDFAIFYNGANCGASAPYHAHFQAAEKHFFNLLKDYKHLPENYFETVEKNDNFILKSFKNYLRKAFCLTTEDEETAKAIFFKYFYNYIEINMLNVVCVYENGEYLIFIFPRKAFRPKQFYDDNEDKRLIISPGTVEMCGTFITPFKENFAKITKEIVVDIFEQIS
jgi:hypothetical protein